MNRAALENGFAESDCIKTLVNNGRKYGYINIAGLLNCLPPDINDTDQIEDIIQMIEDMGITVKRG